MEIRGERVIIRDLQLEDVFNMKNWGTHENPLIEDYNFPPMNDKEIKLWYKMKTNRLFNKYYGILNEDNKLIGYMGTKDIKVIRREATLGIVLDPNYVNKGYGTEILDTFLEYYFTEMKMKKMILEVAEFNKRAYRVYEKVGFLPVGYYLDEFFDSNLNLTNPYYLEEKSSFVITNKKIYNYIYKMVLNKKRFFKLRKTM
ncbi:GNAT family N-acetyltransferase [Tissierella pigra]|uniref:GNAT family N-acetyltransferase n=1 Tax=Tissierella pigra TaxID=2607614 RepID=A0A6N7XHX8_9FIRM|nr:GNAT family N-acetyltransferase [Tissierella pigra]MBU5428327.1 GNAT family N-acetyltransferase [Tissierella pigra]MSU01651.1 GNAT family N-acetyltransferase [Tissierella pigra]